MKRLFILALLILTLTACGSSATNTGTAVTPQPTTPVTQATDTPTAAPTHFKVGQTVKVGNTWQLTIRKVRNDGSATYLEPGQIFLLVQVKAVNISSTEQDMSSLLSWTMRDAEGNTCKAGYDINATHSLDGKVEAGQPLQGSLTFIGDAKVHQYQLFFENNFLASGQTIWDIHA